MPNTECYLRFWAAKARACLIWVAIFRNSSRWRCSDSDARVAPRGNQMAHPQCATRGVQRALLERVVAGAAVADAITPVGRAQEWGNTMVAEAMNLLAM